MVAGLPKGEAAGVVKVRLDCGNSAEFDARTAAAGVVAGVATGVAGADVVGTSGVAGGTSGPEIKCFAGVPGYWPSRFSGTCLSRLSLGFHRPSNLSRFCTRGYYMARASTSFGANVLTSFQARFSNSYTAHFAWRATSPACCGAQSSRT